MPRLFQVSNLSKGKEAFLLEQQMRDGADDQQADDGALQEDDEQLPDVERKLGAEDQTADLGEVEDLRDGDDSDDESGHLAGGLRDQDGGG